MKKSILILLLLVVIGLPCRMARAQKNNSGTVEVERVYVGGNVKNPQEVLLSATRTLTRALAWVGGELTGTDMKRVRISRAQGTQERVNLFVNLKAIREGKAKDFMLRPYDIVCVPTKKSRGANCNTALLRIVPRELPSRVIQ
jgi:hypothetical protein